mmetsp:Transcript_10189/g.46397  ORF Transcript_10189/g.46397 Transcript_10189/m.46397 type:complete len:286 (+) Transcript_10189:1024-1881(+)
MPSVANSAGSIAFAAAFLTHRPASAAASESSSSSSPPPLSSSVDPNVAATSVRRMADMRVSSPLDEVAPVSAARLGGRDDAFSSSAAGVLARLRDPTTSLSSTSNGAGVAGGGVLTTLAGAVLVLVLPSAARGSATVNGESGARDLVAGGFDLGSRGLALEEDADGLVALAIFSRSTTGAGIVHGVAPCHPAFISGCVAISPIFGLSPGLGDRHRRIRSFAPSFTTPSGNSYALALMRLYVACTSAVWNGGVPTSRVYTMTPMDQTSTSNECPPPLLPASTSGAM